MMLIVTAFLAFYTWRVFNQTTRQTEIADSSAKASKISADAAKKSADLQKQALDSQIAAKKQSDIADAQKLKRDTDFTNKQKKGIDAQIAAIKQSNDEFIIQNEPFLQCRIDTTTIQMRNNNIIRVFFNIQSLSKMPIRANKSFSGLFQGKDTIGACKIIFNKFVRTVDDGSYYQNVNGLPLGVEMIDSAN
ncbi:hypothetical protein, partial [uncultured Mucilaginibacter sp.]